MNMIQNKGLCKKKSYNMYGLLSDPWSTKKTLMPRRCWSLSPPMATSSQGLRCPNWMPRTCRLLLETH